MRCRHTKKGARLAKMCGASDESPPPLSQARFDADALKLEEDDDKQTELLATAAHRELRAEQLLLFAGWNHVKLWMSLWGAQHQPMKLLPGGGQSKRVYVCRNPTYGKWCCKNRPLGKVDREEKKKQGGKAAKSVKSCTEASLAATEVYVEMWKFLTCSECDET